MRFARAVIARRPKADAAIQTRRAPYVPLDCFAALAMTAAVRPNLLLFEADDDERSPRGEPQAGRAKRPRALDQRPEPPCLELAERRRRADKDARAEHLRAEDVAERRAARRARAGLGLASGVRKHSRGSAPLDERAHPPRRALA